MKVLAQSQSQLSGLDLQYPGGVTLLVGFESVVNCALFVDPSWQVSNHYASDDHGYDPNFGACHLLLHSRPLLLYPRGISPSNRDLQPACIGLSWFALNT